MFENVSANQLRKAAEVKDKIEELQSELQSLLGESAPLGVSDVFAGGFRKRRGMSAAAKARIAAGQKARWAKARGEATNGAAVTAKPKRTMSAAGRARIAASAKLRWKKAKAAGKSTL